MHPKTAPAEIWRMISGGLLNLSLARPHVFSLDQINEAIDLAAKLKGSDYSVLVPD